VIDQNDNFISVRAVEKSFPTVFGSAALFRYRGRPPRAVALHDITLDVKRGELFGLLGPNGAGKTTLMKLIATLAYPDRGNIFLNGHDVVKHPRLAKSMIGLCSSEDRSFYFRLTARQNLEFFGALAGLHGRLLQRRINDVIELLDLGFAVDRRFGNFSSGMRQRLTVARALLSDPPILLLDEPTRAIDPVHADDLRRLIREELADRQHKTVLLATNLLDEAWNLCDRVAVFSGGTIVALDAPSSLATYTKPPAKYEFYLSGIDEELLLRAQRVEGVLKADVRPHPEGVLLQVEMLPDAQALTDVMRELCANGSLVRDMRQIERKPVDVFRELTQVAPR
jgi:ABC-2 type transport system ATP-binding protein